MSYEIKTTLRVIIVALISIEAITFKFKSKS